MDTADAALFRKACQLGDPDACLEAAKSDPKWTETGMLLLSHGCEAGIAGDCVRMGEYLDTGDLLDHAAKRAHELAIAGCLAADSMDCNLAVGAADPAIDLRVRTIACALGPADCRGLAELQLGGRVARDVDSARHAYEISCLTEVRDYSYAWRAEDCVAGAKLYLEAGGAVEADPARAAVLMKKACALGAKDACATDSAPH